MTDLVPFSNGDYNIRALEIDGEPWFVAKDVTEALGIKNTSQAVAELDDDERSMFNIGRQGEVNIVSEPGLYALIQQSRKPEAKPFKRWVNHDVLPSIRKHGVYSVNALAPAAVLTDKSEALKLLQYKTRTERKEARELEAKGLYRNPLTGEILPLPGAVLKAEVPALVEGYVQTRYRQAKKSEDSAFQSPGEFDRNAGWNNAFGEG